MKKSALLVLVCLSQLSFAQSDIPLDQQIGSFTVVEISNDSYKKSLLEEIAAIKEEAKDEKSEEEKKEEKEEKKDDVDVAIERAPKVIAIVKDLVALGETVYELVKKGKPTINTEYTPVSILPKNDKSEAVDPMFLENFSIPVQKRYRAKLTNGVGKEVVSFEYAVIFSYGGTYEGKGKYIANAQIVPSTVKVSFGWDFNSQMKVAGIYNHGSAENKVVGVALAVKYQIKSWVAMYERTDTIHLTGDGQLKTFASF